MMFPSNSYVDPCFTQNKEQVPYPSYPFYPYPVPSRPDLSAQPASYAPWPCPFNPTPPNGYSYPPGFYCPRPLFHYELPPPNFPNYYHPHFSPMPNYPGKYPQVDNTTLQTHCSGCPNHVCHGTQSPKVKIDEEKPEMDQTKIPHNTYPFFWFSPRNKAQQDEIEKSKKERKEAQFPWPGVWMPEDEIKEMENKNKQFTLPIAWMPEDETKEWNDQNANKQASEEAAKPSFRFIPLKFLENGDKHQAEIQEPPVGEKKQSGEEAGKKLTEREGKSQAEVKRIPVVEKKENIEKGGKELPVKEKDGNGDRVTEKKHSKLPPVCLRVDPLPHESSNNGSSKEDSKKEVRVVDVKCAKYERKEKVIEVKTDTTGKLPERKNDDVKRVIMPEEDKIKKAIKVVVERGPEGKKLKERGIQGEDPKDNSEDKKVENVKRSQISKQDAAVLMQSVYRGYNVRRWEPLKKLEKISDVHKKAQELQKKLQDVEEPSKPLEKEQLVLNESIMNLLLQLDTIQGFLPTVREARKSVARELISLLEKLDSMEKRKAVETSTNESQPQLDVQPTTANVSSEVYKIVPEQDQLHPSQAPALECMTAQEEYEKSHEDGPVQIDMPQSRTGLDSVEEAPVKNEEDACSTTREESQMAPLVEETRPADLLPETITDEKYPEVQLCSPQTAAFHALSEAEMHNTGVTSSIMEEIHDTEVEPGVAVTHGIDSAGILPEINNLQGAYEEEIHAHATESNAEEAAPDVALSETATKEVDLLEEIHDSYAGASVDNVELQETEDGKPSNEEMNVAGNEIASDATVISLREVMLHATEDLPEQGYVDDGDASAEKGSVATEADEVKDEHKLVEENEVTALPENKNSEGFHHVVEINESEAEVRPDLIQTNAMEVPPEVEVTNGATYVGKLSVEEKKLVEENEKLRIMLEKLIGGGKNLLDTISGLNEKVKGLEKKLGKKSKKNKVKIKKPKPVMASSIEV